MKRTFTFIVSIFLLLALIIVFTALLQIIVTHPLIVGGVFLAVLLLLSCIIFWRRRPSTTHGSARFASLREMRKAGMLFSRTSTPQLRLGQTRGLFPRTIALQERTQQAHVLTVAPTRAGKTTAFILPNLLQETGQRSLLINDTKGELLSLCHGTLARSLPCYLFAPTLERSAGYNPLILMNGLEDALDIAECIVANTGGEGNEPFWANAVRVILTASLLHIKAVDPRAPFATSLLTLLGGSIEQLHDTITASPSIQARQVAAGFLVNAIKNDKLAGSIMTELNARLLSLKSPMIQRVTAHHTIPFDPLQPSAIFLQIPPDEIDRLKWIASCFTLQLMKTIVRQATSGRKKAVKWSFYLDEFANMGVIPHYLEYISYVGGLGISLVQCAQDFGQLERLYQANGLSTILANSNTHLVYAGLGLREATHYSDMIGTQTTSTLARSRLQTIGATTTHTRTEAPRKLFLPEEIRTMPANQLLICSKNLYPVAVKTTPYYREKRLLAKTTILAPELSPMPALPALEAPHLLAPQPPAPPTPQAPDYGPMI